MRCIASKAGTSQCEQGWEPRRNLGLVHPRTPAVEMVMNRKSSVAKNSAASALKNHASAGSVSCGNPSAIGDAGRAMEACGIVRSVI